ncbi:MAG: polysaccharide deacetylase family protein [Bryobacteraceae bacterium]
MLRDRFRAISVLALLSASALWAQGDFKWPAGKRVAVSFSFDDARLSQVDTGLPLFDTNGVKATFYVSLRNAEKRLDGWKRAIAHGHEIGGHSLSHACTANYHLSSTVALEDFNLTTMARDLDQANAGIKRLLGVTPVTFAYPCGQKFVGRGLAARSYIPLVAERYLAGRGYLDEAPNDPKVCDLAQSMGTGGDDLTAAEMLALVERAAKRGGWLILVGHEVGKKGYQVTDVASLEAVFRYAKDPANGVWIDTVESVARYVAKTRAASTAQR